MATSPFAPSLPKSEVPKKKEEEKNFTPATPKPSQPSSPFNPPTPTKPKTSGGSSSKRNDPLKSIDYDNRYDGGSNPPFGGALPPQTSSNKSSSTSQPFVRQNPNQSTVSQGRVTPLRSGGQDSFIDMANPVVFSPVKEKIVQVSPTTIETRRYGRLDEAQSLQTTRTSQEKQEALRQSLVARAQADIRKEERERQQALQGQQNPLSRANIKSTAQLTGFGLAETFVQFNEPRSRLLFAPREPKEKERGATRIGLEELKRKNISPLVNLDLFRTGVGLIGTGATLSVTGIGAGIGLTSFGAGSLLASSQVLKQSEFNKLSPEEKKSVIANRENIRQAQQSAERQKKTSFLDFVPLAPSIYEFSAKELNIGFLDKNLGKSRESFISGLESNKKITPAQAEFIRRSEVGGQFGLDVGAIGLSSGSNKLAGDLMKGLFTTAEKKVVGRGATRGVTFFEDFFGKGKVGQVATGGALKTILPTSIAGATENVIFDLTTAKTKNQKISGADLGLSALFGGVSSGSVSGIITAGDIFGKVGRSKTSRAVGKTVSASTYGGASLFSLEEPFGDFLTSESRRAKPLVFSFTQTPTETKGRQAILPSNSLLSSFTQTKTTSAKPKTKASTFGLTFDFTSAGIFDVSSSTKTETRKGDTTPTPTETTTTTPTTSFGLTPTVSTFQNFFPPLLPTLPFSEGRGARKSARKGYYDELSVALDFGGLNIQPEKNKRRRNNGIFF